MDDDAEDFTATEDGYDVADVESYDDVNSGEFIAQPSGEPDVLLDVGHLSVDEISLDVEDLQARVSLQANVLDLLKLSVGADVALGAVHLDIKGVEAQAVLKVRLDRVAEIVGRVLTTIDRNPQILEQVTSQVGAAVRDVGRGAGDTVGELGHAAGSAVTDVGAGARSAVTDVGEGARAAVTDVGAGTRSAVTDVGESAGSTVDRAGSTVERAGSTVERGLEGAVEGVDEIAGEAVDQTGRKVARAVPEAGRGADTAVSGAGATRRIGSERRERPSEDRETRPRRRPRDYDRTREGRSR